MCYRINPWEEQKIRPIFKHYKHPLIERRRYEYKCPYCGYVNIRYCECERIVCDKCGKSFYPIGGWKLNVTKRIYEKNAWKSREKTENKKFPMQLSRMQKYRYNHLSGNASMRKTLQTCIVHSESNTEILSINLFWRWNIWEKKIWKKG